MKLLQIKSSILGDNSVSTLLSDELVTALKQQHTIEHQRQRDFGRDPVPHLDGEWLAAIGTSADQRSEDQQQKAAFSDGLIAELQEADIIVIGAAMYNFSIASTLKAWLDHVARAGVTFKYTDKGSVGLLTNKTVYVVMASGGIHHAGESDFLRPYLQHMLGFLGLTDVRFVSAEGLTLGGDARQAGVANGRKQIAALPGSAPQARQSRVA